MLRHNLHVNPCTSVSLFRVLLSLSIGFAGIGIGGTALAQQPHGWVSNGHISAYTLAPGEFELSGTLMRVNDTLDVLNLREDMLAGTSRLSADSGDLDGTRGELRVGVWTGLELFYRRQTQDMTLKLAADSRVDISGLDEKLQTTGDSYGARWVFFQSATRNPNTPWTSAALELTATKNKSDDFGGMLESINFSPTVNVRLDPPQRFDMNRLKDDGWNAKVIYSHGLGDSLALSYWAGYGKLDSSSGTSTEIEQAAISNAFLQTFDISEDLVYAGINLNWQGIQRLPIQIGYEYINIRDRQQQIVSSNSTLVPSFLRGSNLSNSATANHTLYGSASWWLTPHLYAGISGKVFKNQFVGILPHYNNPLSARFSETPYGYIEFSLGFKFNPGL